MCDDDLHLQRDLGAVILKRFLLLVLLLDQAAVNLSGALRTPLLFKLDASAKESSKVCFSRQQLCCRQSSKLP